MKTIDFFHQYREQCGVPVDAMKINIDGLDIAISRTGKGQPLVCLHAIGHGSKDFLPFIELIGSQYEVICIDWPNHGRSGIDKLPPSASYFADLLSKILEQQQIINPIIIGNSLGGAAAIHYASKHQVRALILCNSAGLSPDNLITKTTCKAYAAFFKAGTNGAPWFEWAYRQFYRNMVLPLSATASYRDSITAAAYEMAPILHKAWLGFATQESNLQPILNKITIPILFAWGQYDRVNPLWINQSTILSYKGYHEFHKFPCGHVPFLEVPEAFKQSFENFISNI